VLCFSEMFAQNRAPRRSAMAPVPALQTRLCLRCRHLSWRSRSGTVAAASSSRQRLGRVHAATAVCALTPVRHPPQQQPSRRFRVEAGSLDIGAALRAVEAACVTTAFALLVRPLPPQPHGRCAHELHETRTAALDSLVWEHCSGSIVCTPSPFPVLTGFPSPGPPSGDASVPARLHRSTDGSRQACTRDAERRRGCSLP
jgi:hypothetical protein